MPIRRVNAEPKVATSAPKSGTLSAAAGKTAAGSGGAAPNTPNGPKAMSKATGITFTNEERQGVETLYSDLLNATTATPPLSREAINKLWQTQADHVLSVATKVLQYAAANFEPVEKSLAAAAAATAALEAAQRKAAMEKRGSSASLPITSSPSEGYFELRLEDERTPAERIEDFKSDNQYILDQLKSFTCCPFTALRLLEILLDPHQYTVAATQGVLSTVRAKKGGVRSLKLQESIRRCVLVSGPFQSTEG